MKIMRLASALVAVVALAGTAAAPRADAGRSLPTMFDIEEQAVDCEGAQLTGPEATSTAHVTGGADRISLDVFVVLDLEQSVDVARLGKGTQAYLAAGNQLYAGVLDLLEVVPQSYEPLGIDLRFVGWDLLAPLDQTGAERERTVESQEIIDLAKAQFGGQRPAGADVVYVATDLDIAALGSNAVAGQADCIGGVANPDAAFAVGEVGDALVPPKDGIAIGPVSFYRDFAAKVAAHEIGHLMGGHHHYQECGTPGPAQSAVTRAEVGACTLMSNAVDFQTLPFGTLNGIVVRGHAESFASD